MATEDVYATLLLNDLYLPGALVLGHSLKDAGTTKNLAVLVTSDSVSEDAISELEQVFDYIIRVDRVVNHAPANLSLMDRLDLHSAFTKIVLWEQLQFRRIVYMDADMMVWRAPDELFDLEASFSAAPDIGWPDLFNTGLLVLKPNMADYWALHAMAQRGISFDGADQGLLNMHFKNTYNRISFSYNVTPSAHYQYIPAYKHFQATISATHFIGKDKPWTQGREASSGTGPYNEIAGRWWAVYDGHFREAAHPTVQRYVKGENEIYPSTETAGMSSNNDVGNYSVQEPSSETAGGTKHTEGPGNIVSQAADDSHTQLSAEQQKAQDFTAPFSQWDPSRSAPPPDSKPEASNFPNHQYKMSSDKRPFKAPGRYPDPPKDMYYEVPKTPTYQKPVPIFPWEKAAPKPTRVFAEDQEPQPSWESQKASSPAPVEEELPNLNFSANSRNAWDDIPEIERYISKLQRNRKGNIQMIQGYGSGTSNISSPTGRRPSMRLTDFPTELERPSLPVTPAPIRRPSFWGQERNAVGDLPAADGVPSQTEWDPIKQLEALARRQSEVLGHGLNVDAKEIPSRPLPYGSEGVNVAKRAADSPVITETSPSGTTSGLNAKKDAAQGIQAQFEKPSYTGPGSAWEKDDNFATQETPLGPTEEEQDALA